MYLPQGDWYYLYTGKKYEGNTEIIIECPLNKLPVFVKAGALLPMQPSKSHTKKITLTHILHVYTGGDSTFTHYEDDGSTFDYQNGDFAKRTIENKSSEHKVILSKVEGNFVSPVTKLRIVFHGLAENAESVTINGKTLSWRKS